MSTSYRPPGPDALAWVAAAVGVAVESMHYTRLLGGITADLDRVTVPMNGGGPASPPWSAMDCRFRD